MNSHWWQLKCDFLGGGGVILLAETSLGQERQTFSSVTKKNYQSFLFLSITSNPLVHSNLVLIIKNKMF